MKLRILIAGLLIGVAAFAAETGAELFQKAVTQERAAGNLEEAIKLYQRVAKEFASDRALAAKALVAEARCYEKLGRDNATKLYEQVAREYRDQPDQAAAANARLAALRQGEHAAAPVTMTQRKIDLPESGAFPSPARETDGQHMVYKDVASGQLMASDMAGSHKRVLFNPKERVIGNFVLSRDSSVVVMVLIKPDLSRYLAVVRTDGTGFREVPGEWSGAAICSEELSWDNRYVLYCQYQPAGPPQLVKFSVADGEIRKLREADGSGYRFSPDGRFVAYHSGKGTFVMAAQGGEPQLVADHDYDFYDWTRDGRYLIGTVVSDGAKALTLFPIKDGQPAGKPVFVRYGNFESGRTAASGALIYEAPPADGSFMPWLGKLNSAVGSIAWEKLGLAGSNWNPHKIIWSPDSTQIAYIGYNGAAGQFSGTIRVRTIATGEERELHHSDRVSNCLWSAKHPSLFCVEYGPETTALSISTVTGRAEPLGVIPDGNTRVPIVLADDDKVVYLASPHDGVTRWEIGAAHQTMVVENPNVTQNIYLASVSPDGRWVTRFVNGTVEIRPISGGDWRPLMSPKKLRQATFTSDGNWFVYIGADPAGKEGIFRVATSGGQPERLGDFPGETLGSYLGISPNGQRIAADVVKAETELWMLENFEPKQQAAK